MIRSSTTDVQFRTAFTNGTHHSVADMPVEKGGAGTGFGPHDLLEAALSTCLTMTVQVAAAKHGISLTGAQCEVRIDRSVPDAVTLNYSLAFEGMLTEDQSARLREAAGKCPVARTLTGAIVLQPVSASVSGKERLT